VYFVLFVVYFQVILVLPAPTKGVKAGDFPRTQKGGATSEKSSNKGGQLCAYQQAWS
jgi:hypothetical protein